MLAAAESRGGMRGDGKNTGYGVLALMLVVVCAGCGPAAPAPDEPPLVSVRPTPTLKVITPTVPDRSVRDDGCPPGRGPEFAYGFAALRDALGERMGDAVSCERYGPDGDALQQTTTGLARYRRATNTPTFTSGSEHWALNEQGLVHWIGGGLDPPRESGRVEPVAARTATATAAPSRAGAGDFDPLWLDRAVALIRDYDRKHGTVLGNALDRVRVVVLRLPGALAAFVPSAHTITLDPVLQTETPEAVATVLAHEAQHAVDQVLNGGARTEVACYSYEISAFRLQAAVWQSFFGPGGKPDPVTEVEADLNEVLRDARTNAGRLIGNIHSRYADQCS